MELRPPQILTLLLTDVWLGRCVEKIVLEDAMSEIDARSMPELRHKPRKCWTLERNSMQRHMSSGAAEKVLQLLSTPRIGVL